MSEVQIALLGPTESAEAGETQRKVRPIRWDEKNPERRRELERLRYAKNLEKFREKRERMRAASPEKLREWSRQWKQRNPEKLRKQMKKWRAANPEEARKIAKRYRETHREQMQAKNKQWREANRESIREKYKQWRMTDPNKEQRLERMRLYHRNLTKLLREEILAAYGRICKCCGDTIPEFLSIDHKYNDGAKHRKETHGGGRQLYCWLKKKGWPQDRFQLLCHNCNQAKGIYGACPHEQMKTPIDLFLNAQL